MATKPNYTKQRSAVIISRKWDNPKIMAVVNSEGISLGMELEDFVKSLAIQLGSPLRLFTREQLLEKMLQASKLVADEMKDASRHVV